MSKSTKKVSETKFSSFIRNASSGEKKRVYTDVLKKATERQLATIREAAPTAGKPGGPPLGKSVYGNK